MSDFERWSYFLIPLPDPLGLKHESVYRTIEEIETENDGAFGPVETKVSVSILIHQVESDINEFSASHDYFELAKKVWPEQVESGDDYDRGDVPTFKITKTIAEVAVSPLDDTLRKHLSRNDERPELFHQFEIALESVNRLIEEYRLVAKIPVRLVTPELLPFLIPQAYGDVDISKGANPTNFVTGIYLLSPHKHFVPEDFTEAQFEKLSNNLNLSGLPHPLKAYINVRNDAQIAYLMHGDYRMATILIATACEILINVVLQSLMWETGKALKSAAKNFYRDFSVSQKLEKFQLYFGLTWDTKKSPELVNWAERIAYRRNDVVHTGIKPTSDEVDQAWAAMDGLFELMERSLIEKFELYPRTLVWFVADRLGELPPDCIQLLREIRRRPEPNWLKLLKNWSEAISQRNRRLQPMRPWGPPRLVINRDQSAWWITTDSSKSHASFVRCSDIIGLTGEQTEYIESAKNQLLESPQNGEMEPLVLAFTDVKICDSFRPEWKPIHELDPMRSYSLDKSVAVPSDEYFVLSD